MVASPKYDFVSFESPFSKKSIEKFIPENDPIVPHAICTSLRSVGCFESSFTSFLITWDIEYRNLTPYCLALLTVLYYQAQPTELFLTTGITKKKRVVY